MDFKFLNINLNEHEFTGGLNNFINKTEFETRFQTIELVLYGSLGFLMPFFITNQLILGVIVNFFLVRTAMHTNFVKTLPIILLPSLGSLTAGFLFGSNTTFLMYFIPFIWTANLVYVLGYKYFKIHKQVGIFKSSLAVSFVKALTLFIPALIMVNFFNFPEIFLLAMGPIQFATALSGSLLAGIVCKPADRC